MAFGLGHRHHAVDVWLNRLGVLHRRHDDQLEAELAERLQLLLLAARVVTRVAVRANQLLAADVGLCAVEGKPAAYVCLHDSPVSGSQETFSYTELLERTKAFAGALLSLGVQRGDRVLILRRTLRQIVDGDEPDVPSTIENPSVVPLILDAVRRTRH